MDDTEKDALLAKIKDLELKLLRMEIDSLSAYKEYDLKVASLSTELATIRSYVVSMKQKALAVKEQKS